MSLSFLEEVSIFSLVKMCCWCWWTQSAVDEKIVEHHHIPQHNMQMWCILLGFFRIQQTLVGLNFGQSFPKSAFEWKLRHFFWTICRWITIWIKWIYDSTSKSKPEFKNFRIHVSLRKFWYQLPTLGMNPSTQSWFLAWHGVQAP